MSASKNEDSVNAVSNQEGEFSSRIQPAEPLTTKGVSLNLVSPLEATTLPLFPVWPSASSYVVFTGRNTSLTLSCSINQV